MDRVVSKCLFNYRLKGVIDEDIAAKEKEQFELMGEEGKKMWEAMGNLPEAEFAATLRGIMNTLLGSVMDHPTFRKGMIECDQTAIEVPTKHFGSFSVNSFVHTPKSLSGNSKKPAIVYAHGGGAVGGTAALYKPFLSSLASDCGVVVFNVDYRLAPETNCPNNVLDFYYTVKYIKENASDLGVDPTRIAIAGESGGGYIVAGTMVMLAKNNESNLVKLAVPNIPMLSDYFFSSPAAMTAEERQNVGTMKKCWKCIAGPEKLDAMWEDPLLFPGKASDELLARMPPTIVWECEFDMFITEATRFAARLRAAGRLLEFVVLPGTKHGSGCDPSNACFKREREAYRLAIQEYLIK